MKKRFIPMLILSLIIVLMSSCTVLDDEIIDEVIENDSQAVTLIDQLEQIDYFKSGALEHILEGELNRKGQAVGFHYDMLPTKKGEIVSGTETERNEYGIYEAKVVINDVEKNSNQGISSFFPDEWDTQDVVDAINEAYEERVYISGNTYEGLTKEGIIVRMYLDHNDKIISAFPIY